MKILICFYFLALVLPFSIARDVEEDAVCDTLWKRQTRITDTLSNGLVTLPGKQARFVREMIERFTGHFTGSSTMNPDFRYVFRMENKQSGVNVVYDGYPLGASTTPTDLEKYIIVTNNPIDAIYDSMDIRGNVPLDSELFESRLLEYNLYYTYWIQYAHENPGKCMIVDFNSIVSNTLDTLERIAAFMGDNSRQLYIQRCVVDLLDDCTYDVCRVFYNPPCQKAKYFATEHIQSIQTYISSIILNISEVYNAGLYVSQAYDA